MDRWYTTNYCNVMLQSQLQNNHNRLKYLKVLPRFPTIRNKLIRKPPVTKKIIEVFFFSQLELQQSGVALYNITSR